jgi:hypothetical protein
MPFIRLGWKEIKFALQAGLEVPFFLDTSIEMQPTIIHVSIGLHTRFAVRE